MRRGLPWCAAPPIGAGTVRGCNIHDNTGAGVTASGWGAPVIEWSHVHGGRSDGVVFNEVGRCKLKA